MLGPDRATNTLKKDNFNTIKIDSIQALSKYVIKTRFNELFINQSSSSFTLLTLILPDGSF